MRIDPAQVVVVTETMSTTVTMDGKTGFVFICNAQLPFELVERNPRQQFCKFLCLRLNRAFGSRLQFRLQAGVIKLTGRLKDFVLLPRSFYRPTAEKVAPSLLGHFLIRHDGEGFCGGAIVEAEAYLADDPACHAAPGLTARNRVMFGEPGHGYVYFIYGVHFCVNAVCQPAGVAEAVLIRAIEPGFGETRLRQNRPAKKTSELTNGPGKLCQALGITRSLNGVDLCDWHSGVFIAENPKVTGFRRAHGPVVTTTRIGITQAAALPLRFYLAGSAFVSRR